MWPHSSSIFGAGDLEFGDSFSSIVCLHSLTGSLCSVIFWPSLLMINILKHYNRLGPGHRKPSFIQALEAKCDNMSDVYSLEVVDIKTPGLS